MANIPIFIPTYINSPEYTPARVQPRLLFYNGLLDCETYYIESGSNTQAGIGREQSAFPYFDNYNVVAGSFPTVNSNSLLFYNEEAVYGEVPTDSLYSTYWQKYVELLYNPRTKLLNASAIIPLAEYFKISQNDIIEFRGNYYHLRAINDYNLKNGECSLQLLGPILADAYPLAIPAPITTTTTSTTSTSTTSTSTTSTSTTSTSTTSTSTTSTSTSTSTSTTTTTTAAPIAINYRIAIPATGTYNYLFTPFSASIFPASFYSPTSSGVLSVINDSTRYAFSDSASLNSGSSIPPILFNAISGSFVCDAGLLPYVTQSVMSAQNTLCSGFRNYGTGSITVTTCDGNQTFPITANSVYLARVGTFPVGSINPTASFYGDGTFKPNPIPVYGGGGYGGERYYYLNLTIYSPGYASQSMWIPTGTYTQINGVPIVAGTKVQYFDNDPYDRQFGFGGTKTQVPIGTNDYLWVHTYTASGDFTYRYQD